MKTLLDVHTHTIASGHAFSTLQEMTLTQETIEKRSIFQRPLWVVVFALTAAIAWGWAYPLIKMGMRDFGIQPDMTGSKMLFAGIRFFIPGTCDPIYFRNLHVVPRNLYGIKLMLGAELNILNTQGDIDLNENYWRLMDIRIAGIHSLCWKGGCKEENTQGVINAMRNPYIQIISHPGDGTAELDFEQLMKVSKETHTLLEINNHSMAPIRHKTVAAPNNLQLLELAKKYETPVIFGSDAHFSTMIADYENIMPLAKKCDFPEELVLNYSPENFLAYIKPMPE